MSNSELPKGWREVEINEIVNIANTGLDAIKRAPIVDYDTGIKCMRIQDVSQNKGYVDWGFTQVEEKNFCKFQLKKNDIIIARTGATVGVNRFIYSDLQSVFNNGLIRIRTNYDDCIPKFLYYHFRTDNFKSFIVSISGGTSSQPNMQINALLSYAINLPPLPEQKAIAEVLSSLDDKIDLLHKQNQTLEDMAQTLFREWFVEQADEGWEEVKLGDYVKCINGYTYKSSELMESRNALVTLKNFARDGSLRLDGFKEFTGIKFKEAQVVTDGDLVVAHTDITQNADIIGNPILVKNIHNYDKLVITMDLVKVEPFVNWIKKSYLYCLFKSDDFKFHCLCNSNGSTVLHMSKKAIPSYIFKLPPKELLASFTKIVDDIFEKQDLNQQQIKTLEQTRDTLLPKLMSGQVRV